MSKLNTTFGGFGLAAAAIAAVAITGCDPYTGANESPPEILGVLVADVNVNTIQPARCDTSTDMGCSADFDCPTGETCVYDTDPAPGSGATCTPQPVGLLVPPTGCIYRLPRRAGGIWGPGYPAVGAGGAWTVTAVPVGAQPPPPWLVQQSFDGWPGSAGNFVFAFAATRVIFNKLMDGATIQTDPVDLTPPAGSDFKVEETIGATTTDVTAAFDVYYDPSSPSPNYGAALVTAPNGAYNNGGQCQYPGSNGPATSSRTACTSTTACTAPRRCQFSNGTGPFAACTVNTDCTLRRCQTSSGGGSLAVCVTNADCTATDETCAVETCVAETCHQPYAGQLKPNATYHVTATTVKDHQARSIPIDVSVSTVQ